jgi:mono/diheme cytochrome c family protein
VRQILGFDLREAFVDDGYTRLNESNEPEMSRKVQTVIACLRCHATWPADAQSPKQPPVQLSLGVSCQACHGPGQKWFFPHQLSPYAWRVVAAEEKSRLGFYDVRSPAKKAELCTSCHVGNIQQEKLVKHEWYAGGHPPLPSFELASFQTQMPVHWKPLAAKPNFAFRDGPLARDDSAIAANLRSLREAGVSDEGIKANYLEAHGFASPDAAADLPRAKDVTVGGAAVLAAYVRLIGDYAALAADNKAAWPELALYDCSACHHELRAGLAVAMRPKRKHVPGRPPPATWPAALTMLAGQRAAASEGEKSDWPLVQAQLLQLDRAMTDRPFGNPDAIRKAAQPLAEALRRMMGNAEQSRYTDTAGRQAVQLLADTARPEVNDFYSARQIAWAIREVAKDLQVRDAERLFSQGADDPLCLALPSGPERSVMENLQRWLPAASKYDALWFQDE